MKKENKSSKWAFLLYKDSTPKDYSNKLKELHVPFILSSWNGKNINYRKDKI